MFEGCGSREPEKLNMERGRERGSRETSSDRDGYRWGECKIVPGQAFLAPVVMLGPWGRAAGLSLLGCQSWLGSRNWFCGSSPRSQPLLAALFGESAGISRAAPTPPPSRQVLVLSSLKVSKAAML